MPVFVNQLAYPQLFSQIDRLSDRDFKNETASSPFRPNWRYFTGEKEALTIEMELPGFSKDDVSVQVVDGKLHVSGSRRSGVNNAKAQGNDEKKEEKRGRNHEFEHTLQLGHEVDVSSMTGKLQDGLLTITLPRLNPRSMKVVLE